MKLKNIFTDAYGKERPVKLLEILEDPSWDIINVTYDAENGKYTIEAIHDSGQDVLIQRNKQYVDTCVAKVQGDL